MSADRPEQCPSQDRWESVALQKDSLVTTDR